MDRRRSPRTDLPALSLRASQSNPYHQPAGACFPGEPATHQGDPALLHRAGLPETSLLDLVADQSALAARDDDRAGTTAVGNPAPGARVAILLWTGTS